MSGGTIAAIVIVVLIVVFGLIAVFYSKKKEMWCFKPLDPNTVKKSKTKTKKSKTDAEAGTDETDPMQQQQSEPPIIRGQGHLDHSAGNSNRNSEDHSKRESAH